jgi:hypothetical protein
MPLKNENGARLSEPFLPMLDTHAIGLGTMALIINR